MPRINYFELQAQEPERTVEFYTKVFGWEIRKWDGPLDYWLIKTGKEDEPGIDGGLARGESGSGGILCLDVDLVDVYAKKIEEAGGKIIKSKHAIPGVGWLCYCADTEGNVFAMMEEDRNAK